MEIITVKPVDFYKRKATANLAANEAKYKQLFATYNCFSDNVVVVIQPLKPKVQVPIVKHTKKEAKTVKRFMLSILNIINTDNYKKMVLKTKIFITHDNVREVFTEILDKCVSQTFYISIYMSLMQDLILSLNGGEKHKALDVIYRFVEDFIVQKNYILQFPKTKDSYQDFCTLQKNKMIIMSKNLILIELLTKTNLINNINFCSYVNNMFKECLNTHPSEVIDVLLQCLIESSKTGVTIDNFDKLATVQVTEQKLKFLIEDLTNAQKSNRMQKT